MQLCSEFMFLSSAYSVFSVVLVTEFSPLFQSAEMTMSPSLLGFVTAPW